MILYFTILIIAGIGIGILSGLLGIGGGTMIIPILRLGFGIDALVSVGTSLFTIIPTSIASLVGHLHNHTVRVRLGILIGVIGCPCALLGSWVCDLLGGTVVMIIAAAIIVYTAYTMFRRAAKLKAEAASGVEAPGAAGGISEGAVSPGEALSEGAASAPGPGKGAVASTADPVGGSADATVTGTVSHPVPKALSIGAVAGFASGLVGLGGGFIVVPLAAWAFDLPMRDAAGTSALSVLFFVIPGAIMHAMSGGVAYLAGIALAIGSVPGALIGAKLCAKAPERTLRIIFGIMLLVAGILLAGNEFLAV